MSLVLNIDTKLETFIKKKAESKKISITEYFIGLAKKENKSFDIKKEIIESMQELSLVKQGKLKANSIKNLFNA